MTEHGSQDLNFGAALAALKEGYILARDGWNGKGMFLYFVPGDDREPMTRVENIIFGGGAVPCLAYIAMKTATDQVVPWLASQTDILAEDWRIVG